MKKKFQIIKPCEESWNNMQDLADGKFCDLCNKKVLDLDKISSLEFEELSKDGDKICGKKSLLNQKFSSVFLAFTLTSSIFHYAQTTNQSLVQNVYQKNITINGNLISKAKRKIITGNISLVTLGKLYTAKAEENGNFTLTFPEIVLTDYNIVRIDYTILDYDNKNFTDYKSLILTTNELLGKQDFEIEEQYSLIGAVVLTSEQPPDYYFIDGKKVGKRKFEKIKKENPNFKYLAFYDEVTVQKLTKKSFIDNLYLLFSN